jgi:uncharacterized protein (TIGR03067 family)
MLSLGVLILNAGLVVAGPKEELLEREQERLAGTWRVVGAEVGGMPIPPRAYRDLTLTFKDGKFTARMGDEEPQEGTYTIDPAKNPREMDISRAGGPAKAKKQTAIYSLAGDLLKICSVEAGDERPADFDTREKPGRTLLTLRRVR